MIKRAIITLFLFSFIFCINAESQMTPWLQWTLLPDDVMDEIIGEASGETAWNTIMETGGYNKDRLAEEYSGTFYETEYILSQLKKYGLPQAELTRMPGDEVWDGITGELWEVSPIRQKLASYRDMTAMLVKNSTSADVTTELVWVGQGTEKEIIDAGVKGKIAVTEGSVGDVHNIACLDYGAAGVIAINSTRPYFDPLQMPLPRLRIKDGRKAKFAFHIPPREGQYLKKRLLAGEKITVHAQVETAVEKYDLENITCVIPGTDPDAGEIIFSAHLFEGYTKQGANDNKSGSAGILEVARVLNTLISEGRIPPPKRTIRFLWGPEFSGTGPWVSENMDIMNMTLCNINMDMVGEWLSKNQAFMCLMRTSYGNPHYINDVVENYYRFVGESNRERIQNRRNFYKVPRRIAAPSGSDEPFYYSIETHYGASDHEVFNDWGVRVPGVMMIAWPDRWYHTSGDRVDKADPTQLKRIVVIGAASAYTIANADEKTAEKIAGETFSNGARRLGHQLARGFEKLNKATKETLVDAYKSSVDYIETAAKNETETLQTINELADNSKELDDYINELQKSVKKICESHKKTLESHMKLIAGDLNIKPAKISLTSIEKEAAGIIPIPTTLVTEGGYDGYSEYLDPVVETEESRLPVDLVESEKELRLLINGRNSVLDIKKMLDSQFEESSELQHILNYIEILKIAGLIEK